MNPSLTQQVQESAERIAKLEMQQRELQWKIVREQRNFERLRILERFETERSILAAKSNGDLGEQARKSSDSGDSHAERSPVSPNADVVQAFPGGRWTSQKNL